MKNLFYLFLLSLLMASCGKDNGCGQGDFVGTYSVEGQSCLLSSSNTTLNVTGNGSTNLDFFWADNSQSLSLDGPLIVTDCTAAITLVDAGSNTNLALSATLDGKTLKIAYSGKFNGNDVNCTETFKK